MCVSMCVYISVCRLDGLGMGSIGKNERIRIEKHTGNSVYMDAKMHAHQKKRLGCHTVRCIRW
jgi:hypothetical protein